jgi:hypothetical protein
MIFDINHNYHSPLCYGSFCIKRGLYICHRKKSIAYNAMSVDRENKMKHMYLSLVILLQSTLLLGHGFGTDTLVLLAEGGWQEINTVCYRAQKKKIFVASYDTISSLQTTVRLIRGGRSTTSCYIQFGFEAHHADLASTPTQEFYNAATHQWVPAHMLQIGDTLLCANNATKTVAHISLVNESLPIRTIQVKHTHTFFVTKRSLLTHNMVVPIAFSVGLSIPFGAAAGGSVGSFFGPATFVVGAAVGCVIGLLAKIVCSANVATYTVEAYDSSRFEQHIKQQPALVTLNEPEIMYSPNYVAIQKDITTVPADTCSDYIFSDNDDNEHDLLCSTTILQNPPPQAVGCGDTTPIEPFKNPGCSGGRELIEPSHGTPFIPPPLEPKEKPGCGNEPIKLPNILINVPVEGDWKEHILTQSKPSDKEKTKEKEIDRYNGPWYEKTEDWIKNSSIGKV